MNYPALLLPLALLAAPLAGPGQPIPVKYQPPSHSATLGSIFVPWGSLVPRTTPVGQARAVFDNPTSTLPKFEVHITSLRPGMASHPVHQHPWEEIILVREGELRVSINGRPYHAGPGTLIFFASHDPHNLTNVGDTLATYYVVNFVTDRVFQQPDQPASQRAVPGMLPSSVIDCDSLQATPTKTGSRVSVVDSPTLTFKHFSSHITTLNPGQSTLPDIMDNGDELFVLKAGVIDARIDGVSCLLKEGSLFYCVPNAKRTFRNIGATPATYQVIKVISERTPPPARS